MFTNQDIQQYIMENLGRLRAYTNWQKSNKKEESNESTNDPIEPDNLSQDHGNDNKPRNSNKDN